MTPIYTTEHALLRTPLGAHYVTHANFAAEEAARGMTLLGIFPTISDASAESIRHELDNSRRVREDAGDRQLLDAVIFGVSVTDSTYYASRKHELAIRTRSGGVFPLRIPCREVRLLGGQVRQQLELPPGDHLVEPIPVTLRRVTDPVKRDAAVARWVIAAARRALTVPAADLLRLDVIRRDGTAHVVGELQRVGDGVIVLAAPFTGKPLHRRDPLTPLHFASAALLTVER